MNGVILLNADYSLMGIIDWHKAVRLIVKKKVEILKETSRLLRNFEKTVEFYVPMIIRLLKFVRQIWKRRVPFNRRNVAIRDNFTCQYCGKRIDKGSTIDHIVPRSKGGATTFDNVVLACVACNCKKDNRTCSEAKMYPKNKPYTPTINQFLLHQLKHVGLDETLREFGLL